TPRSCCARAHRNRSADPRQGRSTAQRGPPRSIAGSSRQPRVVVAMRRLRAFVAPRAGCQAIGGGAGVDRWIVIGPKLLLTGGQTTIIRLIVVWPLLYCFRAERDRSRDPCRSRRRRTLPRGRSGASCWLQYHQWPPKCL